MTDGERPRACWCEANEKEFCDCDVPFIGNFSEADRRIKAGTLRSLDMVDVKAAALADVMQGAERLQPPNIAQAVDKILDDLE
jgi:hypothetical protein